VRRPGNLIVYSKAPISDLKVRFGDNAENRLASELAEECERLRRTLAAK
jgi:hypothetical protein